MLGYIAAASAATAALAIPVVYKLYPWIWMDIKYLYPLLRVLIETKRCEKKRHWVIDFFDHFVKKTPNNVFLRYGNETFTYKQADALSGKVVSVLKNLGLKKGDVLSVMMFNSPMFMWIYIACMKIGIPVAFINTKIRMKSLKHCIEAADAKALIVADAELIEAVEQIYGDSSPQPNVYVIDKSESPFLNIYNEFEKSEPQHVDRSQRQDIDTHTPISYIFTSGTTGLPKPAIVTQKRALAGASLIGYCGNMTSEDVFYTPLPLYHSAASVLGVGGVIFVGGSLVIRNKFSASQFWNDCIKYDATIIQYIGEVCRYLTNQEENPLDDKHKIRLAYGNGLRPEIWKTFQERFKIGYVLEFYAATEGLGFFINLNNVQGSVGRLSPLIAKLIPIHLIKYDIEKDEPVRDTNGRCVRAKVGEPGLFVSQIVKKIGFVFDGYKGKKEMTQKKLLHNVFNDGDEFFNSGDLLIQDKDYNIYFKDRVGDTFRWKGENVSTIEVGNVLDELDFIDDANVYGVEIPGCEGRAGMAAIVCKDKGTLTSDHCRKIYHQVVEYLPSYARPMFLRLQKEMETTGTFKHLKTNLQTEGINPNIIEDPLFFIDSNNQTYIPFDKNMYSKIISGEIRL